ncbi:acyl-phosphate glycerol-3-phosphate acyltransferase [Fluviicoccus keumensis]|uniref:Glycerol-3-phosphate acyltransferase n=1 Tax=Fluviicoccus keumensis TaxID=1435465 RepID=A0A4Q7YKD6_9GAMM|nr:glycerol-3-phosphate 1-O-acyltransferase PlsY [Fluviicoccus keumensis]RZU38112.1 acyl-phosphate glycerol-3-phosphate acyltransferase [Fluviicoccus keumensis]
MSDVLPFVLLAVAYLLGSVCSAILVCRALGLPDPRSQGSQNPGATNVMRIGGKGPALLTLAGDMLKGVPLVLLARHWGLSSDLISAIGLAAFLGHLYPVFFRFEGGKGVATALGVLLALDWQLGLAVIAIWLLTFAPTRISSLGSLTAFTAAPILAWYLDPGYMLGVVGMSVLLIARHKTNIQALLKGEEKKFGTKKPEASETDTPT